jgi:glycosyltransferase involved in cell wall biosynthesis
MIAQKILICLHDFSRGGTERIAIGLAASWAGAGRHVTILCGTQEGGLRGTVDARVKVVTLEPPIARAFLSRFRLAHAMARQLGVLKPDVIFLPGNFHLPLANTLRRAAPCAAIALKISNPPLSGALSSWPGRVLFRYFARSIDGFAALTPGFAHEMVALAPGKPAAVLHDPIYLRPGSQSSAPPKGKFHILWAGRLEPQKDVGLALRTIAVLKRDAHLTILGDGALREETDAMIARMGLGSRVTRIGYVPAIDPYLAQADVLLMTSHYEGQPAVVGEALAHGVPAVSTDCSSMLREMVAIPEAGKIVATRDPADLAAALSEVCDRSRPPREMLAALIAPFEPDLCAQNYLDWFDMLIRHG